MHAAGALRFCHPLLIHYVVLFKTSTFDRCDLGLPQLGYQLGRKVRRGRSLAIIWTPCNYELIQKLARTGWDTWSIQKASGRCDNVRNSPSCTLINALLKSLVVIGMVLVIKPILSYARLLKKNHLARCGAEELPEISLDRLRYFMDCSTKKHQGAAAMSEIHILEHS